MKVDIFNTNNKFNIIYADPPWSYRVWSSKGKGRTAESHYSTMSKTSIENLPIPQICENDCVLFLWVTAPCLEQGLDLVRSWGFTYKTVAFTWVKQYKKSDNFFIGLGHYTRANAEYCLLATRGKSLDRKSKSVHSVVCSHIDIHSKKPSEVRDRIVQLFGDIPRIELFAREHINGWYCWGNEV